MKWNPFFLNTAIFFLFINFCFCQESAQKSQDKEIASKSTNQNTFGGAKETPASDYIQIYQKYISVIRGQECPMYPSCSNFGLKTFRETNFFKGFYLTSDRLLRCGHDHRNYPITLQNTGFKQLDFPAYSGPPQNLIYEKNSYHFGYAESKSHDSIRLIINLINNQYFDLALLEIFRQEEHAKRFDIELFINKIICLKALGKYENALFEFENRCPTDYKSNEELLYHIAHIFYKINNIQAGIELISSKSLIKFPQNATQYKILHLDGLLHSKNREWQKAINSFQLASEFDVYNNSSKKNILIIEKALRLRNKSPAVSGVLSVVPGLGYAYSSHFQTGLSAFIVNGLLTYATYSSFKTKNYGMGILTGIFNLSFYLGNIVGSVNSAKRYNNQQYNLTIEKLEFHSNL